MEGSGEQLSFLDFDLRKDKGRLDVKLFDKRDAFPFSIVRLPFASSNIPLNMFYSSISAEILRIGRICSNIPNVLSSVKRVVERAYMQGANTKKLSRALKKVYGKHDTLKQFAQNAAQFADSLI